jgi:desulfoferrodoxin (superoxide reductase-like protein)
MPKIPNKNEAHIQIIIVAEEDNLLLMALSTTRMPKIPNKNEAHIQIIIVAEEDNLLLMALSTNIAE